jgi:hypothetical protein
VTELPLYYECTWPCSCCGLDARFLFMSQTDQTVCKRCQRHGQDTDKKVTLHRDWWRARDAELRDSHRRESESWRAAADALEAKIVERDRRLSDMRAIAMRGYEQTPWAAFVNGCRRA